MCATARDTGNTVCVYVCILQPGTQVGPWGGVRATARETGKPSCVCMLATACGGGLYFSILLEELAGWG